MIVGLPKEIKDNEYRVGLTPAGVRALTDAGHQVNVEKNAGEGTGFDDALYQKAGAQIIDSADEQSITVRHLEAIDGTPVVDIKPVLRSVRDR